MTLRKFIMIVISRLLRGIGIGISATGWCCAVWFLFVSSSEERIYFTGVGLVMILLGYVIYAIALRYIYSEYS